MKIFSFLLFLITFHNFVCAQTKVDEYEPTDSDSESARIYNFSEDLKKYPENKGLIIIYADPKAARLGNVVSFAKGVKRHIDYFTPTDKVSVVLAEGRKTFFKEMWIISESCQLPAFKPLALDFGDLDSKYFYAFDCLDCDPTVPELSYSYSDLENYAAILKKNPHYRAVIEIYTGEYGYSRQKRLREALRYAGRYRQTLARDYKIRNDRLTIKIKRSPKKNFPTTANLYLVSSKRLTSLPVQNE